MKAQFEICIEALYKCKMDLMSALIYGIPSEQRALSSIVRRKIFKGNGFLRTGDKNFSFISSECVRSLKYEHERSKSVLCDDNAAKDYLISGGDIVFVLEGQYAGASAIIPVFSEGGMIDSSCAGISIDVGIADPFFVVHVLHWWYRSGFFSEMLNLSGIFSVEDLEALEIPLPKLELQKKISLVLLEISGVIEKLKGS